MERNDTIIPTGGQGGQSGQGGQMGQQGVDRYGISNVEYDIISTLSNILEGQEALTKYAADADQAGDGDTATIFRSLQDQNRSTVQHLRNALARHIHDVSTAR